MNYYFLKTVIPSFILLTISSCENATEKSDNHSIEKPFSENIDSISLTNLVRQVYLWREKTIKNNMFEPRIINPSDTLYSGIDWAFHDKLLISLQESSYFDKTFIDNFHNIALNIDEELKKGKTKWHVGDLPPFGYEADPWCNCQDNPDNYWDKITLTDIIVSKNIATFKWTWGDDFFYNTRASLDNGTWRINYLQGFEPKLYIWEN